MSISFPIPVTCSHCGNPFASPFALAGDAAETGVTFSGLSIGPCPNCGKSSMIPDGVYKASAKLGAILFAQKLPRHAARNLLRFLSANFSDVQASGPGWAFASRRWTVVDPNAPKNDAGAKRDDQEAAEKIAAKVESEVPAIKKDNILKVATQYDLGPGTLAGVLIASLSLYVSLHPAATTNASSTTNAGRPVPTVVQAKKKPTPKPHRRKSPKLGRNDKCSCGSGVKAKNCHPDRCK